VFQIVLILAFVNYDRVLRSWCQLNAKPIFFAISKHSNELSELVLAQPIGPATPTIQNSFTAPQVVFPIPDKVPMVIFPKILSNSVFFPSGKIPLEHFLTISPPISAFASFLPV
jgi:hypothetical protein